MTDFTHENLPVVGLHIPDYSLETGPDGNNVQVELPGVYRVGVVIEGVFKPLAEFKYAGLKADIERAQEAQTAPTTPDVQPQQTGTGTDTVPSEPTPQQQ